MLHDPFAIVRAWAAWTVAASEIADVIWPDRVAARGLVALMSRRTS